jgi:hypothetical protein
MAIADRTRKILWIKADGRCSICRVQPVRLRLGPPSRVAELAFSLTDRILTRLTPGPAVMIDRPPPPAAPKSGHRSDRPCHFKAAGQTHCLQKLERAIITVAVPKTRLKCQSFRPQGSLRPIRDCARKGWPLRGSSGNGARHSPGVSSQVGTQSSPTRALFTFTHVDGTGRSGPAAASPMGRPMVSAGDEVSASLLTGCATASDMGLCRRAGCSPSATEGGTSERGTRARHRQLFVDRTTPSARSDDPKRLLRRALEGGSSVGVGLRPALLG